MELEEQTTQVYADIAPDAERLFYVGAIIERLSLVDTVPQVKFKDVGVQTEVDQLAIESLSQGGVMRTPSRNTKERSSPYDKPVGQKKDRRSNIEKKNPFAAVQYQPFVLPAEEPQVDEVMDKLKQAFPGQKVVKHVMHFGDFSFQILGQCNFMVSAYGSVPPDAKKAFDLNGKQKELFIWEERGGVPMFFSTPGGYFADTLVTALTSLYANVPSA